MAAYDIRMMKLVSGEIVLGKYDAEKDQLTDVAQLQNVPTQQGMQMLITPYGFPFENKFHAVMEGRFILYRFSDTPKELQDKYIEVTTNLTERFTSAPPAAPPPVPASSASASAAAS